MLQANVQRVSRRKMLLGLGAGVTGAIALAACSAPAPAAAPTAPPVAPATQAAAKPTAPPAPAPTTAPAAAAQPAPTTAAAPAPTTAPAAAAQPAPTTAAAAVKRGGTLSWAETDDPISFDPHTRSNASASVPGRLIYQSFARHNPQTMMVEPVLATQWNYTSPTEVIWTLRQGVTFHNGQPFTADDVKWNVDRMTDPATANPFADWYKAIASTEAVDKYTVKMTLNRPDPVLPGKFAAMRVSGFAPAGSDPAALASMPIGTGPYKMAEWAQNDHVTLQRNGSYWEDGIPYLDTLSLKILHQEDTRIAALRAGEADWALVSGDGAKRLAGANNLKTIMGPQAVFTVLKLHQRFKPFQDVRVRQALDMATDRKAVINTALGGAGQLTGPIPYGWEDYGIAPDKLPYTVDIAKAKSLLSDAGYGSGFEVTCVTLPEGGSDGFYATIATVADQWKQVGVQVTLQPLELAAWLDKNNKNDFDLIVSNRGFRGDPIDILMPAFHSGGSDNQGYMNAQVEQWLDQSSMETDRTKRRDLYLQVQQQLFKDVPWLWLWVPIENDVMQKTVNGYTNVAFDSFRDQMARTWLDR